MSLALELARFVTDSPAIPGLALDRAKASLASTVASAAMGQRIPSAAIIRKLALVDGGQPAAALWFDGARLPLAAAARVNAVASDAAASDDSDLRSIAHIGTIISTTAIAVGEMRGASGAEMLRAMVLGYEIAGRIDEALTPGRMQRGFHGSVSTIFGAAVTAGCLLRLDAARMAQAIALAATSAAGMAIAADTSTAREYHAGLAASGGIQAALAAEAGFKGETDVLDKPRGFLDAMNGQAAEDITRGLGEDWDIVTDMAIKLMPGAHPFHATAEAAEEAGRLAQAKPEEIESILISSSVQWTKFKGAPHPRNLVDAAHSLYYFVAASIVDGRFSWQHMGEAKMADPVIAAVQEKVVFDPNPAPLPDRFPHRHGGTVTIRTTDGRSFTSTCKAPRGSGPRGVDWADIDAKYRALVPLSGLSAERLDNSLALIARFETEAAPKLTELLVVG
ncbi:MmgE/PrpD family protein [Enterovirga rhinocerotis]|uniref:2-methylcitrate dehydratase PrpD n=1 Tax=Enterovirga rhinocerotis TaxID=1339210 RepID=A0A4R7C826_9HYPH|nr:MmgE/PrpD family protein [Enterovirga rhinocerotis]TDR94491.1 2-methylcitrate dehydratase PrpD [Enterovirga rhinocerotis]